MMLKENFKLYLNFFNTFFFSFNKKKISITLDFVNIKSNDIVYIKNVTLNSKITWTIFCKYIYSP